MCQLSKKIHRLERAQYAFLDHSKTLVFSDVIKIEILFKVAQWGYARSRSARQCHKSKVNIRGLFGIFQIKATET